MKKLTLTIPHEILLPLSRRVNGRKLETEERNKYIFQMSIFYHNYQKAKTKLDYCDNVWWDEKKIEQQFMKPKWYYAHRKRKKLMADIKEAHKNMFYVLLSADGNYEPFDSGSMTANEIMEDFNSKYCSQPNQ